MLLLLGALLVTVSRASQYGNIEICDTQWVKPGDLFEIACKTSHGLSSRIYLPSEEIPSHEEIESLANEHDGTEETQQSITINEYEDATKGVDDGYYTCIVQHGPGFEATYSTAKCLVIIEDLCETAACPADEVCEADYETGTAECNCNMGCPFQMEVLCTDTCELFWNECAMTEQVCKDKKPRSVDYMGFCAGTVKPITRDIDMEIPAEAGEEVTLASGLIKDGTPQVSITWTFAPQGSSEPPYIISAHEIYTFTLTKETAGTYYIRIVHCRDQENSVQNRYTVNLPAGLFTTAPPDEEATTTPPALPDNIVMGHKYVCSSFAGGVLEQFDGESSYYDLDCTHVLAADMAPAGDISNPWFVYGTYDQFEGKASLESLTFYLGSTIFEMQRGWLINLGGEKKPLEEGVEQQLGDCTILYADLHLSAYCPHFTAHYDGLMSAHLVLGTDSPAKEMFNLGLCWDGKGGEARPNWLVNSRGGTCGVDVNALPCAEVDPEGTDCDMSAAPRIPILQTSACGVGASDACAELSCGADVATAAQECTLRKARRVNCALKFDEGLAGVDEGCPEDECEWKNNVVAQGCPQENPPFDCPSADSNENGA